MEENEDFYRDLVEHSQDLLWVHDLEGRFLSVNPGPARLLGYSVEEMLRKRLRDVIDPQLHDQCDAYLLDIVRTGEFCGLMAVMTRAGEQRTWEFHSTLRTEGVETPIVRAIAHDVTERVRTEKALRESELRFRAVCERSPVGISLVDSRNGRFLQVNPKFCEIAGRSEEELLRTDVGSITHPGDVGHTSEYLRQLVAETLANYETDKRYLRPDGSVRWVRVLAVPMWGKGETRRWHMALVQDITERRQSEEAIASLVIAATNRDLADSVRENEFRSDLYYRLNVFPIRVPPLRERREDIRLLVEHFVQKFARRMNKSITSIPKRTMDGLMGWDWPGNVRELENFIERSVILTQGSVLVSPSSELKPMTTAEKNAAKSVDESLKAAEREHILRALRESHGQIGGLRGAAMRLGLKRTTLQSKLKHLGINPRSGSRRH
ncbi:MAG: PAS domain S-box protein [Terriglobales bacterium]